MALTSFEHSYTINHEVDLPNIVAANEGDGITIVLKNHPVSGARVFDRFEFSSSTQAYVDAWENAANVAYTALYDQLTGTILTPGPPDQNNDPTFIERAFSMTLSGTPSDRHRKLHVYVSESVFGGGGDPDDGSWTGDIN